LPSHVLKSSWRGEDKGSKKKRHPEKKKKRRGSILERGGGEGWGCAPNAPSVFQEQKEKKVHEKKGELSAKGESH